jgi:exopolysaccharide production protein ExoZ
MVLTRWTIAALFVAATGVFLFFPASGDQVHLVTGVNRIVFVTASVCVVMATYKARLGRVPRAIRAALGQFGIATYGVYLLHPIVAMILGRFLIGVGLRDSAAHFIGIAIATVTIALLSYRYLETPMIRIGKKLTRSEAKFLG